MPGVPRFEDKYEEREWIKVSPSMLQRKIVQANLKARLTWLLRFAFGANWASERVQQGISQFEIPF
jgi:hypothetical protein